MGDTLPAPTNKMAAIMKGLNNKKDMDRNVLDLSGTSLRLPQSIVPKMTDDVKKMVITAIEKDASIIES
jgi:hypothetical protein